jgi:four helix bundle protein
MKDFRNLLVWRKAHALTLATYVATTKFNDERFGLPGQMRRGAVSMAAKLAEDVESAGTESLQVFTHGHWLRQRTRISHSFGA